MILGRKQPKKRQGVSAEPRFPGLSSEALEFLRDLKRNNNRDWFRERKGDYERLLHHPIEDLVRTCAAACDKRGFPLFPKDKNPLTRIYRDIRFSPDKTPFHTYVGASLRRPSSKTGGEIYIHISSENSLVAAGFWMPPRQVLHAWRERMTADPKAFQQVLRKLDRSKLEWLGGYSLKRLPRGFEAHAGSALEAYFKKQVFIVHQPFTRRDVTSAALVQQVADFAVAARPLLEFGWSLKVAPLKDILEA
jgi:uncharacterized protein (TIGR02453 family)